MPPFSVAGLVAPRRQQQPAAPVISAAERAYDSLCYDFPIVETPALAALAAAYRSDSLGNARLLFPITSSFLSGLRYLATSHFEQQKSSPPSTDLNLRGNHLMCLCGSVFLKAPARRFTVAHHDNGASLNCLLASFKGLSTAEMEDQPALVDTNIEYILETINGEKALGIEQDQMADVLDNDDTEWEPIETQVTEAVPIRRVPQELLRVTHLADWPELISKVIALTTMAPFEITSSEGAWEELCLTEDLIQALKSLKILEKDRNVDVMALAKLYAGLLCDHVTGSSNLSTRSQKMEQLVTAVLSIAASSDGKIKLEAENRAWEHLALRFLATLCCNMRGSRRSLWQTLSSTLPFLEQKLACLSGGSPNTESMEEMELVFQILSFWLEHSPGNASVGSTIMQELMKAVGSGGSLPLPYMIELMVPCFVIDGHKTGILRTALQAFFRAGKAPQMEALREFLLLAMARSTEVAQYLGEVPAFRSAISDATFLREDSWTRPHGLVWPLLLQAGMLRTEPALSGYFSEAEYMLVNGLNQTCDLAENNSLTNNPLVLTRLLQVLQKLSAACSGSSNRLWQARSPLDSYLSRCHGALRTLLVTDVSTTRCNEDTEGATGAEICAEQKRTEKAVELLSRLFPLLKQLTAVAKGDGCSKSD